MKCPDKMEVLNSSSLELMPSGQNIFESCNNEYWRSSRGRTGVEAEFIVDLKCPMLLESFSIINGFGDFGTERFTVFGSRNPGGPWTSLHRGELPEGTEMKKKVRD